MSTTVKVGQVWQDKDKRRDTRIEIIAVPSQTQGDAEVTGLVVGTEDTRTYRIERLVTRWKLIKEAPPVDPEVIEEILAEHGPKAKYKTREQWLEAAVKEVSKLFVKAGFEVPQVRVSVGWPGGRGKKANVIGQCFATKSATDSVSQIFVSPVVADPLAAVVVIAHEMIHAVDDCENGHKKKFIEIAKAIGFTPKWTVATADTITDDFKAKLEKVVEKLGTYPHAAINPTKRPVVQKTYMLKVLCSVDSDYFVRMTQGKIEDYGTPICPCHHEEMEVEEK